MESLPECQFGAEWKIFQEREIDSFGPASFICFKYIQRVCTSPDALKRESEGPKDWSLVKFQSLTICKHINSFSTRDSDWVSQEALAATAGLLTQHTTEHTWVSLRLPWEVAELMHNPVFCTDTRGRCKNQSKENCRNGLTDNCQLGFPTSIPSL